MSTIKELRENAVICRRRAATKSGTAYTREVTRALEYDGQVRRREEELNLNQKNGVVNGGN